jgi:hypothetical protein
MLNNSKLVSRTRIQVVHEMTTVKNFKLNITPVFLSKNLPNDKTLYKRRGRS